MDQAPRRGPSSSPRREGAGPPSTLNILKLTMEDKPCAGPLDGCSEESPDQTPSSFAVTLCCDAQDSVENCTNQEVG